MLHFHLDNGYEADDLATIKNDWHVIRDKVASGHADSLSESDTNYLAACTKGANSKQLREAPAPAGANTATIFAKQRAFSLKTSYMTAIARKLLNRKSETVRLPIPQEQNLDEYVAAKFIPYTGKSSRDIASEVVPEFLRTLVFARPRGDDQFADCTFSPSLDMSR